MSDATHGAKPGTDDPFTRVYRSLRRDLATGALPPGDQIFVTEVARRLGTSPTPVREALAKLVGERLVEDRRRYGYFVPLLSWFDFLELCEICEMLVIAALHEARDDRSGRRDAERLPASVADPSREQLATILALSRNVRLTLLGNLVLECLAAALRTEDALYADSGMRDVLDALIASGAWTEAIRSIRRRFRMRRGRAEAICHAMARAHRARNRPNID